MKSFPSLILAPFAAALAGWMLSGSPVPMVFSLGLIALSIGAGFPWRRCLRDTEKQLRRILPFLLAGAFTFWEIRLFQSGGAMALRAELPLHFHLAMGTLWWVSADSLIREARGTTVSGSIARDLTGIAGGLLLLHASASTMLYDFGPWMVFPLAAFPFTAFSTAELLPRWSLGKRTLFAMVPAMLFLTGMVLFTETLAARTGEWLGRGDTDTSTLSDAPPSISSDGSGALDGASHALPRNSDVTFTHRIQVSIRAHSPRLFQSWKNSPLYLRTSTLALFESDEVLSPLRSGRWLYDIDDGNEDNSILLKNATGGPSEVYTLYIPRSAVGHIPLLSNTKVFFGSAVYEFADDWFQLSPAKEIQNLRYTATTSPASFPGTGELPEIAGLREQEIPGIYLQLPPSPLADQVRALTDRFDRQDPLRAIRTFLEKQASYSLHFNTPEESSPVEDFLFGSGKGHCEHYAAATVLMLRALGVPSRVAYGYAGGAADPSQKLISFRDSDFHAWAEIMTPPANRWVIFDTTPRVPGAAPGNPAIGSLPFVDETNYEDFSEFNPGAFRTGSRFSEMLSESIAFISRHFLLFTLVGLSLLAVIWLQATRKHSLDPGGNNPLPSSSPVSALPCFLHELENLATRSGITKMPGHTWKETLQRLIDRGEVPGFAGEAVDYHYSVRYGKKERNDAVESDFLSQFREWKSGPPRN